MLRRLTLAFVVTLLVVAGPLAMPGGSDAVSEPFAADGTVVEVNSPVGSSIEGESAAFKIGPPGFVPSSTAASGVDGNGHLKIYVTPSTTYYKQSDGAYTRSTYSATIVQNDLIRVHGRRVLNQAGEFRFIATTIWNGPPPSDGGSSAGSAPACGATNGMSNQAFRFIAVVAERRVRIPCTGIGGQPGGFRLHSLDYLSPAVAQSGVSAYGGAPDIYVTPLTTYRLDGRASSFDEVVLGGLTVQVDGRYQYMQGLWLFVATRVDRYTTPPTPAAFTRFNLAEDLDAGYSSGTTWQGAGRGGAFFGGSEVRASLTWTQTSSGWSFSGTFQLINSLNGDRLNGSVSGTVSGTSLTSSVTITGGAGRFNNATGAGVLDGTAALSGSSHPTAFDARLTAAVDVPN